jgi:hypothetical protein
MRQLTVIAAFVSSIGTFGMSLTHVTQVDAVSTLALELRIRKIRNSPNSRQEPRRLRGAQCRKLIRTLRTTRQAVANPGRVDEFQLSRTAEDSSMFARRTSFLVFTKHAVEFTVVGATYYIFTHLVNKIRKMNGYVHVTAKLDDSELTSSKRRRIQMIPSSRRNG